MARNHALEKTFRAISAWQLSVRKADGQIRGAEGDVNDLTEEMPPGDAKISALSGGSNGMDRDVI